MASHAHVILTDYGSFGWGITSPQLSELVGGYNTYAELDDALPSVLIFGGLESGGRAERHVQRYVACGDDEIAVRVAQDARVNDRGRIAVLLQSALRGDYDLSAEAVAGRSGDVVIVCCMPDDHVRWALEQTGGQPVGVAYLDGPTVHLYFVQSGGDGPSLSDLGESVDSTVAQLGSRLDGVPQDVPVRAPMLV